MEPPKEPLTEEQKIYLKKRIQSLRSKQQNVGWFRQAGIQRTINGMKEQLKEDAWNPLKSR